MWIRKLFWTCLVLCVSCEGLQKDHDAGPKEPGQTKQMKDAGDDRPITDAGMEAAGTGGRSGAAGASGRAGGSGSGGAAGKAPAAGSGGSAGKPPAAGGGSGGSGGSAGSGGGAASPPIQPFTPKNVPPEVNLGSPGELILNTANCGDSPVIDTAKGVINGCTESKIAGTFTLMPITQSNTSLGTLEAGLLVTRRFVIEQGMKVSVEGNRPLIVVALDEAIINGHLQASGAGGVARAGGFGKTENGQNGLGPGGGGRSSVQSGAGGAGFCGKGGAGSMLGMNGGKTYGNPENEPLIGGSSGGAAEYTPSVGGGAVQISAGTRIDIGVLGVIHVGGGGVGYKGNGGGSGGAILLEAPKVRVLGRLAANGGGGSSGLAPGASAGADATDDDQPAIGGQTAPKGGNGSAGSTIDGQPGDASGTDGDLGGGGGGGAGRIRIDVAEGEPELTNAVISPAKGTACFTIGKF